MLETLKDMTRCEARSFLQSAFDCAVPAELLAYADTLPAGPEVVETLPTLKEQRAAIWSKIREVWSRDHRWDTHWEQVRLRKAGYRGAIGIWKEKRRRTAALLAELADLSAPAEAKEAA